VLLIETMVNSLLLMFDMTKIRGETTDLAVSQPQTVQRLKKAWLKYADEIGVVFSGQ
jgi:hypothetical protein